MYTLLATVLTISLLALVLAVPAALLSIITVETFVITLVSSLGITFVGALILDSIE